jgi:hypothetical protein
MGLLALIGNGIGFAYAHFGLVCQYSTGAKQLIGLVMALVICRGGKGVAGAPLQ